MKNVELENESELPSASTAVQLRDFDLYDLATALLKGIGDLPDSDSDDFATLSQLWELSSRLSTHPTIISFDAEYEKMCADDEELEMSAHHQSLVATGEIGQ
jgi:hypothetical protein